MLENNKKFVKENFLLLLFGVESKSFKSLHP